MEGKQGLVVCNLLYRFLVTCFTRIVLNQGIVTPAICIECRVVLIPVPYGASIFLMVYFVIRYAGRVSKGMRLDLYPTRYLSNSAGTVLHTPHVPQGCSQVGGV